MIKDFFQFIIAYRLYTVLRILISSRVLRNSTPRFVGLLVCWSVGLLVCWSIILSVTLYFFWVFAVFGLTAPAQMIK